MRGDRSDSAAESFLRAILVALGLKHHQQVNIWCDRGNFLGRVDVLLARYGIIIEVDGEVKYSGRYGDPNKVLDKERVRANRITNLGYRIIRISWQQMENGEASWVIMAAVESERLSGREGRVSQFTRGSRALSEKETFVLWDGRVRHKWRANR